MSTHSSVKRDERTVAVENTSFRCAFNFVISALFLDFSCRAMFFHEAAWDLFALATVPGTVCLMYQVRQKTVGWDSVWKLTLLGFCAAIVSGVIVAILAYLKVTGAISI